MNMSLLKIQNCSGNKDEGEWWRKVNHVMKIHLHVSHLAFQITGITLFTSNTNVRLSEK